MKVEVTEEFKDKYTKKLYTPGDVIEVTKKGLMRSLESAHS